jgi:hypothetical protein
MAARIHRDNCRNLSIRMTGTCGIKIGACRHLQWRGVQFLSCHTALEEQVGILAGRNELWQSREEVMEDMLAPYRTWNPSNRRDGAALALLQAQGHYTYVSGQRLHSMACHQALALFFVHGMQARGRSQNIAPLNSSGSLYIDGKRELESCSASRVGTSPQAAAVRLNDRSTDRKSHTCAVGFRGEKCIKDLVGLVRR